MKARDVIGRCIKSVEHARFYNKSTGRTETVVDCIRLDNGSVLVPFAFETGYEPAATIQFVSGKPVERRTS